MSLAEDTRRAVRERPWLFTALRAGVVNYAAVARSLDVGADADAVATALRRFEERLPPLETEPRDVRVTIARDVSDAGPLASVLLEASVDGNGPDPDDLAAVSASGSVDATVLEHCLGCLRTAGIEVEAAAVVDERLVIYVPRRSGPDALRAVEAAVAAVPASTTF